MRLALFAAFGVALAACGSGGGSHSPVPIASAGGGTLSGSHEVGRDKSSATSDALFIADSSGGYYDGNGAVLGYSVPTNASAATLSATLTLSQTVPLINGQPAGITGPTGIAFDPSGNLWIGDSYTDAVFAFTNPENGNAVPLPSRLLAMPSGMPQYSINNLAFDKRGNLWVQFAKMVDSMQVGTVQGYSIPATGPPTAIASDTVPASVRFAFDPAGNLWVVNGTPYGTPLVVTEYAVSGNTPVQKGPTITLLASSGFPVNNVGALAFDAAGDLWIVENVGGPTDLVAEYNATTGALMTSFSPAKSVSSSAGAFDPQGHLWILAIGTLAAYAVPAGTVLSSTTGNFSPFDTQMTFGP